MHDQVPMWIGLPLLIGIGAFLIFAFRGSSKIKRRPGDHSTSDASSIITDNNIHRL